MSSLAVSGWPWPPLFSTPIRLIICVVDLLTGVGRTDGEWRLFSGARVGHLRVGITDGEASIMWPDGEVPRATADAGPEGVYRPRIQPTHMRYGHDH